MESMTKNQAVRQADYVLCCVVDGGNKRVQFWPRATFIRKIADNYKLDEGFQSSFVIDCCPQSLVLLYRLLYSIDLPSFGEGVLYKIITLLLDRMLVGF